MNAGSRRSKKTMSEVKYVLDASALLAAIQNEKGGERVKECIDQSCISSVNWSEVLQKIEYSGAEVDQVEHALLALGLSVVDFTAEDAKLCASLWGAGKKLGLSLADRACLATGARLQKTVITADGIWADFDSGVEVEFIR